MYGRLRTGDEAGGGSCVRWELGRRRSWLLIVLFLLFFVERSPSAERKGEAM